MFGKVCEPFFVNGVEGGVQNLFVGVCAYGQFQRPCLCSEEWIVEHASFFVSG